jgi:hypothetical protein
MALKIGIILIRKIRIIKYLIGFSVNTDLLGMTDKRKE